jgi:MFS family permease
VLVLNADPAQMGLLRAVEYAPAALFGLFAGVWIDRVRRRPVLILTDLGRGLLLGSVPLALFLGVRDMNYLYAVGFLVGALTIFFSVAYAAYLPSLVRRESLVAANGRLEASRSVAGILGPGLSGTLVQLLTAPLAILVDAASFFVSAALMLFIRAPEPEIKRREAGLWREIGAGLRATFGHPLLRLILVTSAIFNLFTGILNAQFVLYATRDLHITPLGIGGIGVASSVCGLLAASLAGWIGARVGIGRTITVATSLIAAGWFVLPLAQGTPELATLLVAGGSGFAAMGDGLYNVNAGSLRQLVTPHALQGRVSASMRVVIWGVQPLGALAGGSLGVAIGLRYTLLITACGYLLGFLFALFSPLRGLRGVPTLDEPDKAPAEQLA